MSITTTSWRRLLRAAVVAATLDAAISCSSYSSPTDPSESTTLTYSSDPAAALLVTSDLTNFWAAYDAGGRSGSTSQLQQLYLNKASAGLKDFINLRSVTAASLAQMVGAYPRYFAAIRAHNLRLATDGQVVGRIRANYAKIQSLYPAAVFPPLTLLVGRFSTGGTISNAGMLIGTEFYSLTPGVPTDELQQFQRDNVKSLDSLPIIVAHEHVHIMQGLAAGIMAHANKNLLEQSLLEGSADFVGELSSAGNINARLLQYALPREPALWAEFKLAMHGTNVSQWLHNQGTANGGVPGDLGYFIGYRIAQAYYTRMADKRAALKDIIEMRDADAFLTASGYSP